MRFVNLLIDMIKLLIQKDGVLCVFMRMFKSLLIFKDYQAPTDSSLTIGSIVDDGALVSICVDFLAIA